MNTCFNACADEVTNALTTGRAVVALESTLVAHGLPWPDNLETALAAETAIRDAGAVPATIAILDGVARVGLTPAELERVARSGQFRKAAVGDLATVVAKRLNAATTVSATLAIAHRAGILAVATGGIGGVHPGSSETPDISADLDALARAGGMLVVCSGAKSILDLPATLEALETRGVPVLGYRTSTLPAFTEACSGLPLEWRVETPHEAAAIWRAHQKLGLGGAVVLAQPVPGDHAVEPNTMARAVQGALEAARRLGVSRKALTPFLLDQVRQATGGASLTANRALIVANASLAAQIAVAVNAPSNETT